MRAGALSEYVETMLMSPQQPGFDLDAALIAQIAQDEQIDEAILTDRITAGTVVAMGGEGVRLALDIMSRELQVTLALTGCNDIRDAGPHLLQA